MYRVLDTPTWDGGRRPSGRSARIGVRLLVAATLAAAVLMGAAATSAGAQEPLVVNVTSVGLDAFPTGSAVVQIGGPAALDGGTLDGDAFTVTVDGRAVDGIRVTPSAAAEPVPTATLLLIDESGSMKGDAVTAAAEAARRYVQTMRAVDTVAIMAFNEETRVLHDFTSDRDALSTSLEKLLPARETALYDAVNRALTALEGATGVGSRYLVLLSDGGDTASVAALESTLSRMRAAGVQLYAVGLKTNEFDATPLTRLAEVSGGRYLETPDPTTLAALYDGLAKEIQNQYVIELPLSPDAAGSGAGTLEVAVTAAGVTASGKRGFFYPAGNPTPVTAPAGAGVAADPAASAAQATQPAPLAVAPGPTLLGRLVDWPGGDYAVALLVAMLLFGALWLGARALFPRRNVLAEYADILENRHDLGPPPTGDEESRVSHLVDRLLRSRGYQGPLQSRIEDAGWRMRSSEFASMQIAIVLVAATAPSLLGASFWIAAGFVVVAVVTPLTYLDLQARRRRSAFEGQVPATLTMMANALRAGQGFEQALRVVADEGPGPTAHEFHRLLAQQRLGVPPEETLRTLADRMGSEAFDWVVLATTIQRQVGGNLAEIYDNIAATLREREVLRSEIRTLTAEGRLSAFILIILPFAVALGTRFTNPPYVALLYTTRPGLIMVGLSIVAMTVGVFWLRRIIRFDV